MARELVISSTTDTQDAVNQAAGVIGSIEGTATQVVENEPEVPEEPKPEPKEEKPQKSKYERKIDKLTFEANEERRKREELEARLAAVEAAKPKPIIEEPKPPAVEPTGLRAKPNRDGINPATQKPYETIEEYFEDLADWKVEKKLAEKAQAEEQAAIKAEEKEIADNYQSRVQSVQDKYPDWNEVMGRQMDLPPGAVQLVQELENGPDVAYYLGSHPEYVKELMGKAPWRALADLGRLAASLEAPPTPKNEQPVNGNGSRQPDKKPLSSAPAPIPKLTGHATKTAENPEEMSYSEYKKWRAKQEKERYR